MEGENAGLEPVWCPVMGPSGGVCTRVYEVQCTGMWRVCTGLPGDVQGKIMDGLFSLVRSFL